MKNTKHLVIGLGQIVSAIRYILDADYIDLLETKVVLKKEIMKFCI